MIFTVIAILYLFLRAVSGYHHGFLQTIVRTLGLIVIWVVAFYFSRYLGQIISPAISDPINQYIGDSLGEVTQIPIVGSQATDASTKAAVSAIAFLAIVVVGTLIVNLIAHGLRRIRRANHLGFIDGIISAAVNLVIGIFIVYIFAKILTIIPWQNGFIANQLDQAPWIGRLSAQDLIKTDDIIGWLLGDNGPADVIRKINQFITK